MPTLIPEITYHIGVTDDLELGGRVALGSLGMEADAKYRFFRNEKLHLAVDPAIGYQAFILFQGTTLRLPVILTYDLADNFSFNAAAFFGTTSFDAVSNDDEFASFDGTLGQVGGALGFDIRGETFAIRPAVEWTDWEWRFSGGESGDTWDRFSTINVMVHFEMLLGREKKQLNRMERKLDRVIENQGDTRPPVTDDSDTAPLK